MRDLNSPRSGFSSVKTNGYKNSREPASLTETPLLLPSTLNGGGTAPSPDTPPEVPHAPPAGRRSLRMQARFLRSLTFAAWLFVRLLFWYWLMQRIIGEDAVKRSDMARWTQYAREFRAYAIRMGGVMIKLGQFVSSRVDVLPPQITNELAGLQDEVPPVPHDQIMAVLAAELGPTQERFSAIDAKPVAAASLGQVYRARLLDGQRVVIKVQRPGIREVVYTDLAALKIITYVANRFRFIRRRADMVALGREFGRVLLQELSYKHEAYNARRFARMFKDDMGIYIPAVYDDHSTDSVLVMEDVTTIKISDTDAMKAAGISPRAVAKRLMDCYLKQVFEERFFHADPHPGNLFVYPLPVQNGNGHYGKNGRPFYLIFIDFGMTGSLTPQVANGLINTLAAIVSRDARKLIHSYAELGFLMPDADMERIEEATKAAFDQVWGLSMTEIKNVSYTEATQLADEFKDLLFDMPFQVPQDFIYLGRALGILSGMATKLDPDFNPWQELQPYAQKMIAQTLRTSEASDQLGIPLLQSLFNGGGAQALGELGKLIITRAFTFPQQVDSVLNRVDRGELTLRVSPSPTYRRLLNRLETQAKRTTRAVIFGSLLVSSTLLYTSGEGGLAFIGYALSGFTLLTVLFGGD